MIWYDIYIIWLYGENIVLCWIDWLNKEENGMMCMHIYMYKYFSNETVNWSIKHVWWIVAPCVQATYDSKVIWIILWVWWKLMYNVLLRNDWLCMHMAWCEESEESVWVWRLSSTIWDWAGQRVSDVAIHIKYVYTCEIWNWAGQRVSGMATDM